MNGLYQASWHRPLLENLQDVFADRRRADRVEQDLDAHARRRLGRQRLGELAADVAGPVDVGLDRDRDLGRPDRLEHRRVELVAVVEDLQRVAGQERHRRSRPPSSAGTRRRRSRTRDRGRTAATLRPARSGSRRAPSRPCRSPSPTCRGRCSTGRRRPRATRTRTAAASGSRTAGPLSASAVADPAPSCSASGGPRDGRATGRRAAPPGIRPVRQVSGPPRWADGSLSGPQRGHQPVCNATGTPPI